MFKTKKAKVIKACLMVMLMCSLFFAFGKLILVNAANNNLVQILNPSFETVNGSAAANWSSQIGGGAQATITYCSDGGYDGSRYYRIVNNSNQAPGVFARIYQSVSVQANTTYTVSIRARTVNANICWFGGWGGHSPIDVNTNGVWKRFTTTYTTGTNETTWEFMILSESTAQQLDIDYISIVPDININYNTNLGAIPPLYQGVASNPRWEQPSTWLTSETVNKMDAINISQYRIDGVVHGVCSAEGVYDWKGTDVSPHIVYNKLGGSIVPFIIAYSPQWLSSNPSAPDYQAYPPTDNVKYAQIAYDYVRHYNQGWDNGFYYNIRYWEVWNEPNLQGYWTANQYGALYKEVVTRIKSIDSTLKVGGPTLTDLESGSSLFMTGFLDYVKNNNLPLDFVSFHNYSPDVNRIDSYLTQLKGWLSSRGMDNVEILVDEWNMDSGFVYEPHDDYRAAEFTASFLTHMIKQGVSKAMRFKDKELYYPHNETVGNWGFLHSDDSSKKSYYATKAFDMLNETNTRIDATGTAGYLDVIAGKNSNQDMTIILVNMADDYLTTNLNLINLPYTGNWVETHYCVNSNYDWQTVESTVRTAASSYTRVLDLPGRSITIIRLKNGSTADTISSRDINLIDDAHNAKWETTDGTISWNSLRGNNDGEPYHAYELLGAEVGVEQGLPLINNGGMEQGLWSARSGTGITLDSATYLEGIQSVKFVGATSEQWMASSPVKVDPKKDYRIRLHLKTNSVSTQNGFSVNIIQVDSSGNAIAWYPNGSQKLISTGGTQDWTKYIIDVNNLDPNTVSIQVYLRMDANITGTVWADAVSFWTYTMVKNGGFDRSLTGYSSGNWSRDTTYYNSGDASIKVNSSSTEQFYVVAYPEQISVNAGNKYKLSTYIKTNGVTSANGISINLLQIDSSGNAIGWYGTQKLISTDGTHDWQKYEVDIANMNSATAKVQIYLRMDANAGGTAWFDDILLMGSKGIAMQQKSVKMENGTVYSNVLAMGTPMKNNNTYIRGNYHELRVPTSGTVTVSATGGFKAGHTGESAIFSIKYYDYTTGIISVLTSTTHTHNGNLVTISSNLSSLTGKKIDLFLSIEENGASADGAAWTVASITGL